MNNIMQKKQA